jgi:hypothetical protein
MQITGIHGSSPLPLNKKEGVERKAEKRIKLHKLFYLCKKIVKNE